MSIQTATLIGILLISLLFWRQILVNAEEEDDDITEVKIADYPYMVSVYYYRGFIIQRCTGTFITNRFILTSGVCFKKFFLKSQKRLAVIGSDRPGRDSEETDKTIEVECGFLHPDYHGSEKPDDVAVLRLKDKITTSAHPVFGIVCIPPFHNDCARPKECYSILYDINDKGQVILARAEMEMRKPEDCKKDFGRINIKKQVCAKLVTKKRANALLHSGSALMCPVTTPEGKTMDAQFGIVNFDFDSVVNKFAGVFINAPYYRDWMESIVEQHREKC